MNTIQRTRVFVSLVCLTVILSLAPGKVNASPTLPSGTDFTAIDAYVSEQMDKLGIPGMALGIVQGDQIAHLKGFGAADSSGRAVTPQTPFYIGSVSKSFTALAVMQLVEAGRIDLDAPVQTYLPWFELADKEASARITVRNLLNQTTGMSTRDGNRFWTSQQGLEEVIRGFNKIQLTRPVGETWQYSNLNYSIAALIVEKVSGQSYSDYVSQHIFEPLDMRHSYASRTSALADGLTEGHQYRLGYAFLDESGIPPFYLPSGGLISSVEDMTHYLIAQENSGQYSEVSILSPQGMAEMHAPGILMGGNDYYAMGLVTQIADGKTVIWHNGETGRFHSYIMLIPEQEAGIVLLANASGFEQVDQVDQIAKNISSLLNGNPAAPISQSFVNIFLHWSILLTPLLQVVGMVIVWRKRQNFKPVGVILTVVLNIAVVLLLFGLSLLIPFSFSSLLFFYPDIGYGLLGTAILGIGWSVFFTGLYLVRRRSK